MSNEAALNSATPADAADTWSHVDLTGALLELALAQIKHALADNDETMMALAEAHQAIGNKLQAIATALTSTQSGDIADDDAHSNINQSLGQMIMAFQGHDALNQRMEHVCETLQMLQEHIMDEQLRNDEQAWDAMIDQAGKRCTMESEREVFRKVMNRPATPTPASDEDIELF